MNISRLPHSCSAPERTPSGPSKPHHRKPRFTLGPPILLIAALILRASVITNTDHSRFGVLDLLWADTSLISLILISVLARSHHSMPALAALILLIIESTVALLAAADASALALVNRHAWPEEVVWILPSITSFLDDLPMSYILAILFGVPAIYLIRPRAPSQITARATLAIAVLSVLAQWGLGASAYRSSASSYLEAIATRTFPLIRANPAPTLEEKQRALTTISPWLLPKIPADRRSIILIASESLSSVDSALLSGINNYLPRFDSLSKRGRLFTNGFANAFNTCDGIAALMTGFAPINLLDGSQPHRQLPSLPSRIREFVRAGYYTEFLSPSELEYGAMAKTLHELGFSRVLHSDMVDRFRTAPHFTWDAAPDHVLFEEALERVSALRAQKRPFLLTLLTITGHDEIKHPLGGPENEAGIRAYVDQSMVHFIEQLEQGGHLHDTTVIITGDHRKQYPLRRQEVARFGIGAIARIPVLLLGAGVKAGTSSQPIQQIDILDNIDSLARGEYTTRFPIIFKEWQTAAAFGFPPPNQFDADGMVLDPHTAGHTGTPFIHTQTSIFRLGLDFPDYRLAVLLMQNYQTALAKRVEPPGTK